MYEYSSIKFNKNYKVAFLGNCANKLFNSEKSWADLTGEKYKGAPYNLRTSIANIHKSPKEISEYFLDINPTNDYCHFIHKLINSGFTLFLTSNFSYELEYSLLDESNRNIEYIKKHTFKMTKTRLSNNYSPSVYVEIPYKNKKIRIWHIHGECRKPNSLIFSIESYNKVYSSIMENKAINSIYKVDNIGYNHTEITYKTWADFLYLNDVYFIGYGLDYCEFDIWSTLIDRIKQKEIYNRIYVFNVSFDDCFPDEKVEILKDLCVIVKLDQRGSYLSFFDNLLYSIEELKK